MQEIQWGNANDKGVFVYQNKGIIIVGSGGVELSTHKLPGLNPIIMRMSPDGKSVAIVSKKSEKKWLISNLSLSTNEVNILVKSNVPVSMINWSPTSDMLSYVLTQYRQHGSELAGTNDLWIYDLNKRESSLMLEGSGTQHSWSMDGQSILATYAYNSSGDHIYKLGAVVQVDIKSNSKEILFNMIFSPLTAVFYYEDDNKCIVSCPEVSLPSSSNLLEKPESLMGHKYGLFVYDFEAKSISENLLKNNQVMLLPQQSPGKSSIMVINSLKVSDLTDVGNEMPNKAVDADVTIITVNTGDMFIVDKVNLLFIPFWVSAKEICYMNGNNEIIIMNIRTKDTKVLQQ